MLSDNLLRSINSPIMQGIGMEDPGELKYLCHIHSSSFHHGCTFLINRCRSVAGYPMLFEIARWKIFIVSSGWWLLLLHSYGITLVSFLSPSPLTFLCSWMHVYTILTWEMSCSSALEVITLPCLLLFIHFVAKGKVIGGRFFSCLFLHCSLVVSNFGGTLKGLHDVHQFSSYILCTILRLVLLLSLLCFFHL